MQHFKTIFADYKAKRAEEVLTDWGSTLLYRPLGLVLAHLLSATRVTPNAVTAVGAILLPCMVLAMLILHPATALAVVLVLSLIYLILDCTDGTLARATGQVSVAGHYWDLVTDLVYRGVLYSTVGYLADQLVPWSFSLSQAAAMAVAAWAATIARLARYNLDRLAPTAAPGTTAEKFTVFSFLSGLDTLFPLLAAGAWALDSLPGFVAWIVIYSLGDAVASLLEAHGRLGNR
ncbi:MAG: CDP-alcohol phosphatidyltransferase family protein [Phyllobacteriaceae bacterium]|nr:CDP-alcohol phosphatidyltransferase family protein [Phyllobacteriaceae bacterium]